jgi:glutamine synthetase
VSQATGANLLCRAGPAAGTSAADATYWLSALGEQYLAGLLAHARGMAVFCTPTVNGFGRFAPNLLAPQSVLWGRDNRGAMLRVLGGSADPATRIENRIGEPSANPYLYIASQIHAGLDGIQCSLSAGRATDAPYAGTGTALPANLGEALDALTADSALVQAFGEPLIHCLQHVKRSEWQRHQDADDKDDWQRREYFSRF